MREEGLDPTATGQLLDGLRQGRMGAFEVAEGVVAAPSDQSIVTLARYERVAEIGAAHHVVAGKHLALHPARVTEGEGLNIDVEAPCLPISAPRS